MFFLPLSHTMDNFVKGDLIRDDDKDFKMVLFSTKNVKFWPVLAILSWKHAPFGLNNPVAYQKFKMPGMATIDILAKRALIKDDDKDFAMMWWDSSSP